MTNTLRSTAIVLTMLVCAGCNWNSSLLLPADVAGVWTTDDPRYQGKFLELSRAFVIVVSGPDDAPSVQSIDRVETEPAADGTTLTVYSTDHSQDAHYQLTFRFSPANGGEIRFTNQSQTWKRKTSD